MIVLSTTSPGVEESNCEFLLAFYSHPECDG